MEGHGKIKIDEALYARFEDEVTEAVKKALPAEYKGSDITIENIQSSDGWCYRGMALPNEDGIGSIADLKTFYMKWSFGTPVETCAREIIEIITAPAPEELKETVKALKSGEYEKIKDKLYVTLPALGKTPEGAAVKKFGEFDAVCRILVSADANGVRSALVKENRLAHWGIDKETLFADAMENSERIAPPVVERMANFLATQGGLSPAESADVPPMYVVTTELMSGGAAAMFYPGMLDSLAGKFDGACTILPSSVNEIIAIQDVTALGEDKAINFDSMVREINATMLTPDEVLGNNAFRYDMKDKKLERVADYEARKRAEEAIEATKKPKPKKAKRQGR